MELAITIGGIKVKIIRIIVRLAQVLAFLVFCFFMWLLDTTGHPYNMGAAAIVFMVIVAIEIELFRRDRLKEQGSVCTS